MPRMVRRLSARRLAMRSRRFHFERNHGPNRPGGVADAVALVFDAALGSDGSGKPVAGTLKCYTEPVPAGREHVPTVRLHRGPQDRVVVGQR
jgi:hypothetical protein